MDFQLAVVIVPVSDVDQSAKFYADQVGFTRDYDMSPNEHYRIVQLTPPVSATSIAIGVNLTQTPAAPGSVQGLRLVVQDITAARDQLTATGVQVTDIDDRPWGRFAWFADPDGNGWELNQPIQ